ncbi:murein biosynthesis integral membrane protein MurJ [Spongisporangium articulatum]|uniref:Murein biosynthesis integral membrane protein MurJ n=1 Tax=Spongisporangium articulatum TaxID=3362603 RepID=A0ABW8ASJ2_9ACTN
MRGRGAGGLLGAAALIAVVTALARVVGFGRWLVFSGSVGAHCVGSAYSTANQLPNVLFEVAAGGALAAAVVPLLAGPLARRDTATVDRVASALIGWVLLVLVPVSLVLALLAGPITDALLDGDSACAGQQALSMRLLLVFAPQIALYGLGVVLTGVLQAHRRFFWPALAPLISSLVMIGGYLAYAGTAHGVDDPARLPGAAEAWLGWGTTAAVAAMTLPLLVPVHRAGVRLRPTLTFPPGVARRGLALAGAGVVALLAQQVSVLVVVKLANYRDPAGALNLFQYVQAVYLLPYAVLAVPLATTAFPRLAEQAASGALAGFARTSAASTRAVVLAGLLGVGLLIAGAPAVTALFAATDRFDVHAMNPALVGMAPGLLGFALIAHVGRALYALGQGRPAAVATATGWSGVVVASLVLVALMDDTDVVVGLAWGNTVGMLLAGGLLLAALARAAGSRALTGLGRTAGAGVLGAGLAGVVGHVASAALLDGRSGVGWAVTAGALGAVLALTAFALPVAALDRRDLITLLRRGKPLGERTSDA